MIRFLTNFLSEVVSLNSYLNMNVRSTARRPVVFSMIVNQTKIYLTKECGHLFAFFVDIRIPNQLLLGSSIDISIPSQLKCIRYHYAIGTSSNTGNGCFFQKMQLWISNTSIWHRNITIEKF